MRKIVSSMFLTLLLVSMSALWLNARALEPSASGYYTIFASAGVGGQSSNQATRARPLELILASHLPQALSMKSTM